ncbi:hypothetical protein D3C76_1734010 [compost metagenome]
MEGVPATEVIEMFADNSTNQLFRTVQDQGMEIRSLSFSIGEGEVITISKPGRR